MDDDYFETITNLRRDLELSQQYGRDLAEQLAESKHKVVKLTKVIFKIRKLVNPKAKKEC